MIPLLLLTLSETVHRLRHDPDPGEGLKRALLVSFLPAALLLALLPSRAEPYGYPLLRSVAQSMEQLWRSAENALFYRNEGERQFSLSFNGEEDDAALSDAPREDSQRILFAYPDIGSGGTVYLFGNAWDRFNGRSWSSSLSSDDAALMNWKLDTAEHIYALWRLLRAEDTGAETKFTDFFRAQSVYLTYRSMNARTMFTVMNATHIYTDESRFPYADAPAGSLFDYVQRDDTWYRVFYLQPNSRTLGRLIVASEGTLYDSTSHSPLWYRVGRNYDWLFHLDIRDDVEMERTLAARTRLIRSTCLDSSGVSDRARALAESITAQCGSDSEKLAAIASYLQSNYSYTLHPRPAPDGANFLDWLLFESAEGYCTWYATAAVLLARSVGVPARYVQGYRGELAEASYTALGAENAHAWCEGYIAGYGWVTVEATPGFSLGGAGWLTSTEEQALRAGVPETAPLPEDDLPLGGVGEDGKEELSVSGGRGDMDETPEAEAEPERRSRPGILIPFALLAALPAVQLLIRVKRKRRYAKADNGTKLRMDLERLLRDLRGMGYPRQPEESLRQYFARLPWRYFPVSADEAEEIASLYDRTFFAQLEPDAQEVENHRRFAACFRPRPLWQRIWFYLRL